MSFWKTENGGKLRRLYMWIAAVLSYFFLFQNIVFLSVIAGLPLGRLNP